MIRIEKLNKIYNKGQANALHVLHDLSLELPDKGMVAVFGRSGCGKTTLLNICGGLDRFDSGEVLINGEDIRKDTDTLRNREIGYIFQNYNLNQKENVQENVADALRLVGMKDEAEISRRAEAALAAVGMLKYRRRLPNTLSGGQQQRVAIARAIVKNPRVVLADEPTGNLDEANTLQVMDMLRSIAKEHLVILVTHEANLVDLYCDRVIELSDGRIVHTYENEKAMGADAAGRREIYLGELPRRQTVWALADVEYYGEAPEEPLHLIVVNQNGRMYLKVDDPHVQILDENSEIKLREGVYEARPDAAGRTALDLSALPPVEAGTCGRLFHLKNAVRSGFEAVSLKKKKKGSRLLRLVMVMFAAILVLMSASFGTSFRSLGESRAKVASDLYYVGIGSSAQLEQVKKAALPEHGVDSIYYRRLWSEPYVLPSFSVVPGHFITSAAMNSTITVEAYPLAASLLPESAKILAGKADGGAVLTKAAADELLEGSSVGYLKTYEDLLGLPLGQGRNADSTMNVNIAAVAEGSEKTIYLPDDALADWLMSAEGDLPVYRASAAADAGITVPEGKAVILAFYEEGKVPEPGEELHIRGVTLETERVINVWEDDPYDSPYYHVVNYDADQSFAEPIFYDSVCFLVSDADYQRIASSLGKTDESVNPWPIYDLDQEGRGSGWYAVLHAENKAEAEQAVQQLSAEGLKVYTPEETVKTVMKNARGEVRGQLIGLAVMTGILCLCMYFIMRAGLMSRVKEVGICRAIGVTKRNLVFRFLIESLVLCGVTVMAGFLISSILMRYWVTNSALMKLLFHYPLWMCLSLFVLLLILCVFCGIIPILLLLRRTPSEILAKYDI